ncbi:MAG: sugar phosphate isomerase/epimerase family protein [Thermoguttaceae bacterium]
MQSGIHRRGFLKSAGVIGLGLAGVGRSSVLAGEFAEGAPNAEKLGWRVACCAYSFNRFTFYEALQRTASLGLKLVEGFSWQPVSTQWKDVQTNETMPSAVRKEVKRHLAETGMKLVGCYMAEMPNSPDACRRKFDWGKELGVEYFVAEPPLDAFDLLEKLCDEYQIALAVHNHPKPHSVYWNPETIVKATQGRSKRLGCCADTGHWVRSGLDPVECLKKVEGRLISFHLKDIVEFGKPEAEDVVWGTGKGNIEGVLEEVYRQKARPVFGIEYERGGETRPELARCLAYFDKVAAGLAGRAQ